MKIMITGGAGFIGYHLTDALLNQGHAVTVYDSFSASGAERVFQLKEATIVRGDVIDGEELYKSSKDAEVIYHLAAQTSVPDSMQNPRGDMETNLKGTTNVLEVARRTGARFIFASSGAVYGQPKWNPACEGDSLKPISFYGLSKKAGEEYCAMYHERFNVPCVVMRIFNCYGPHCHGVVRDVILRLLHSREELRLLGRPDWTKDFIYISDVIRGFNAALDLDSASEFCMLNIGSGNGTRLEDLVGEICRQGGYAPALHFTGSSWDGDVTNIRADISEIEEQLGWAPQVSLPEGIYKTLRWFRSYCPVPQLQPQVEP